MQEKKIPLSELYPLIEEALKKGGSFRFSPQGVSMLPFLKAGRDEVLLSPVETPKKYDVCLFRRENGAFVLHRIVAVEKDGSYTFAGDNQAYLERSVPRESIIGRVTVIFRDGASYPIEEKRFVRYARRRVARLFFRLPFLRIRGYLYRIFKGKSNKL